VIPSRLAPDLVDPPRAWRTKEETAAARRRARVAAGICLVALGILGLAVWGIFMSPFGFTRFPLVDHGRTFSTKQAGTYVVYLEFPGESHQALPPALDIEATGLGGEKVDVEMLGHPGQLGAPDAYHVWHYEGRAVAIVHLHHSGAFLLGVTPKQASQVDSDRERIITEGTIAIGRGWGRGWPTTQWCGLVLLVVPSAAGIALLVTGRRPRTR
jgi:hypothetical protein